MAIIKIKQRVWPLTLTSSIPAFIFICLHMYMKSGGLDVYRLVSALIFLLPIPLLCFGMSRYVFYVIENNHLYLVIFGVKFLIGESKIHEVLDKDKFFIFKFLKKQKRISTFFYDFRDFRG